jgi:hypothetical protein
MGDRIRLEVGLAVRTSLRPAKLAAVGRGDFVGGLVFEPGVAEFSIRHNGNELVGDLVRPP